MESKSREHCKIRKRGNSSSSSSTSVVQKYRFKRAILVAKRGASSTPVPTWKTTAKSPTSSMPMPNSESTKCPQNENSSISARKLAASLWEINNISPPKDHSHSQLLLGLGDSRITATDKLPKFPHLSDPSYFSQKMDRLSRGHRRRASVVTKKLQLTDNNLDSVSNASFMETEIHAKGKIHKECVIGIKTRLKDVSNGLTASKELLKVLNHIWGLDEQHSAAMSIVSALRVELDRARVHVDQLIRDQRSSRNEIEYLLKHFEEEKAAWKSKERERIRNAIACVSDELDVEKKLRRQTERLNKRLGAELAETKASLSQALKELESEKRAKAILEQVCDELARGIGEDRAEVEELKRQSEKVKQEVEKEREMLQLADVLREERVQMKLSDAKYHFEEKNAAVERLRHELEAYLKEKVAVKENGEGSPNYERIKELEAYLKEIREGSSQRIEKQENEDTAENGEVDDQSADDSDLHSIELNMDDNCKSYKWSYASDGNGLDIPRRVSVDTDFKGRKSISENIQWGSICLQGRSSNNGDGHDSGKNQEISNVFDREGLSELESHSHSQDQEDEITRYKSIKSLRDHIMSNSRKQPVRNFASPTREWGQSLPFQDSSSAVSDSSPVLQDDNLMLRVSGTKGERKTSSRH